MFVPVPVVQLGFVIWVKLSWLTLHSLLACLLYSVMRQLWSGGRICPRIFTPELVPFVCSLPLGERGQKELGSGGWASTQLVLIDPTNCSGVTDWSLVFLFLDFFPVWPRSWKVELVYYELTWSACLGSDQASRIGVLFAPLFLYQSLVVASCSEQGTTWELGFYDYWPRSELSLQWKREEVQMIAERSSSFDPFWFEIPLGTLMKRESWSCPWWWL